MIPDFQITILGNTSSIPVHGRNHTAQVVRFGQTCLLLDCGEGTQIQMRKFRVKSSSISYIFISHLHGDHYLGLMGILSSYNLSKRTKPLTIYGPRGLDEIITTQFKWSNTRLTYPLSFIETRADGLHLLLEHPQFTVHSFPLTHRLPTTGFLIREKEGLRSLIKEKLQERKIPLAAIQSLRHGKDFVDASGAVYRMEEYTCPLPPLRSYAFCSDTRYEPRLAQYLDQPTLLYHESTFMEDEAARATLTFHSTARQAAELAKLIKAKSLILGHFSSRYVDLQAMLWEARAVFADSELSEEGATYTILPPNE
ncbi:ribonuclease Z [Algoriphagus aestuariicola]|uniref:Ribonuclease Z n=1 Tax=Algoriphagus aestuariicola TaxID=1852016 RepID=A0ABS3BPK1_9BACT|nr:ribonuclease Z [Algoriphagus aestuariicola]MBN7800990.1 ribonuclease Z [Algoriphagus aestuariicola]